MKKKTPYAEPQKRKPFFRGFKQFLKIFIRKPKFICLGGMPEEKAIIVSNHSAASGPLTIELYYPRFFIPWGTFEMCRNYRGRFQYLYRVYYRQKKKYPAFFAYVFAAVADGQIEASPDAAVFKCCSTFADMCGTALKAGSVQIRKFRD